MMMFSNGQMGLYTGAYSTDIRDIFTGNYRYGRTSILTQTISGKRNRHVWKLDHADS